MTLVDDLVALARRAAGAPAADDLRVRLTANLVAAIGFQDLTAPIERALPAGGPGMLSYRLAARMHARTQDDFYPAGRSHVGATVIPAVLATGTTSDLLPALAAGYEVLTAVSEAYSAEAQARGLRPTGIFGPIGAAAAAAVALDLSDDDMGHALAIAATSAAGTNQPWLDGSDEWLLEVAAASRAGVEAAHLAASGVHGAARAFEGDAGWAMSYLGDLGGNRLKRTLAAGGFRTARVAVKLHAVSGIAQVPTELAVELARRVGSQPLQGISVRMSESELAYPGSRNVGPFRSRSDALMSVTRCVAIGFLHGSVPFTTLTEPPSSAEEDVMRRTTLVGDPELDETAVVLRTRVDGETIELEAHGADHLYPRWAHIRDSAEQLSLRSEAELAPTQKLIDEVTDTPTADGLLDLMGVTR